MSGVKISITLTKNTFNKVENIRGQVSRSFFIEYIILKCLKKSREKNEKYLKKMQERNKKL